MFRVQSGPPPCKKVIYVECKQTAGSLSPETDLTKPRNHVAPRETAEPGLDMGTCGGGRGGLEVAAGVLPLCAVILWLHRGRAGACHAVGNQPGRGSWGRSAAGDFSAAFHRLLRDRPMPAVAAR